MRVRRVARMKVGSRRALREELEEAMRGWPRRVVLEALMRARESLLRDAMGPLVATNGRTALAVAARPLARDAEWSRDPR